MPNKLEITENGLKVALDEKGALPIIVIVVAVVVVAAVGGYLLMNKSGGGGPSVPGVPSLTLNPNCKENDPDLCKFINGFKEHKEFKINSVTSGKDGKTDSVYESTGEDNYHMVTSADGKEMMNMIVLGDTTYTKDYSDDKWWKQVASKKTQDLAEDFKKDYSEDTTTTEDKTTYKKIGKEACGSMQCFKYQVIDPANTETTEYIFFDDREYQLRKTSSEDKEGNTSEANYTYGGVKIAVPSPTKDAKEGDIINPMSGAGMSESDKQEMQKAMDSAKNSGYDTNSSSSYDSAPAEDSSFEE
jgi:hypothetical protein